MRTNIVALSDKISQHDLALLLHNNHNLAGQTQRLYPVLDVEKRLKGVVTRKDLQNLLHAESQQSQEVFTAVIAYPDEPLRAVINRMAETGYTRLPVVERSDPRNLVGMISVNDLLKARVRSLEEERLRERVLRLRLLFPSRNEEKIKEN